jgi:hypothetical protein
MFTIGMVARECWSGQERRKDKVERRMMTSGSCMSVSGRWDLENEK